MLLSIVRKKRYMENSVSVLFIVYHKTVKIVYWIGKLKGRK